MAVSAGLKAGELRILGSLKYVRLDTGDRVIVAIPPSSHHDPVLEVYGTSRAENEDDINIYRD